MREPALIKNFLDQTGMDYLTSKLHEVTSQGQMAGGEYPDETCELLTELLSIIYKTVPRGGKTEDVVTEECLGDV